MARPFAKKFYSSKAWQDCRNTYAERVGGLCENCLKRGIYKPGVIVHHVIEITPENIERPEIVLNYDNLELLCRECHAEVHGLTGGAWGAVNDLRKKKKLAGLRYKVDKNGAVSSNDPPHGSS